VYRPFANTIQGGKIAGFNADGILSDISDNLLREFYSPILFTSRCSSARYSVVAIILVSAAQKVSWIATLSVVARMPDD